MVMSIGRYNALIHELEELRRGVFDRLAVVRSKPKRNTHRREMFSRQQASFRVRIPDIMTDKRQTGGQYGS
ncbi:hypothetical protein BST25_16915 [Mycobacterium heidelbergense]|uniref:Uncharacterized protein n=1 Tax=Mycobacterium heidelbergense TaxID=53376 RepID=A0A1X0DG81_MYCHE|nr:hypothetical protein BST25_16915 [Mycobacterium heidelbergense]